MSLNNSIIYHVIRFENGNNIIFIIKSYKLI